MSAPALKIRAFRRPPPLPRSLEPLRQEARTRLEWMRARDPAIQLTDAQRAVAHAYGFRSWRHMKASIERRAAEDLRACLGFYRHDPARFGNLTMEVRLQAGELSLQALGGPRLTLQQQADGCFAAPGLPLRYVFLRDDHGAVTAMTADCAGHQVRLERISESEAQAMREAHQRAKAASIA